MSVSIASFPRNGSGNEWLGRLCLKYVNRKQQQEMAAFAELWADPSPFGAGEEPGTDLEVRTLFGAGGVSALIRLYNEAYVGAGDYREAGWMEALALQTANGYDPSLIYIAYRSGRPVAFCMSRKCGQTGRITGIGVRPECRGRGIATALLRHAMKRLAERGATEVYLHADTHDAASRRLYTKLGFGPR